MPLRVTFAEQSTGIVTTPSGEWSHGPAPFQKAEDFFEAIAIVRAYLEQHPAHEAWIGSTVTSHRLTPPVGRGFDAWLAQYRRDRTLGSVRLGMNFGEVVTTLGWPDDCSVQLKRSPLAIILRYQPLNVDFHFDDGGRLHLIHQDDPDQPVTILAPPSP